MRITFRVSTAGKGGFMRLPLLSMSADSYFDNGKLDETRVRQELGRLDCVQFSSNDDRTTLVVVVDILDRIKSALDNLTGLDRVEQHTKQASSSEERMDRGRYATVRLDVSHRTDGFRISLRTSSPNDVPVKSALEFASFLSQAIADNIVALRDDVTAERKPGEQEIQFTLVEGDGCDGVFARAETRNAKAEKRKELTAQFATCERRHDCHTQEGLKLCSPCKFDCPCFKNGGVCDYENLIA